MSKLPVHPDLCCHLARPEFSAAPAPCAAAVFLGRCPHRYQASSTPAGRMSHEYHSVHSLGVTSPALACNHPCSTEAVSYEQQKVHQAGHTSHGGFSHDTLSECKPHRCARVYAASLHYPHHYRHVCRAEDTLGDMALPICRALLQHSTSRKAAPAEESWQRSCCSTSRCRPILLMAAYCWHQLMSVASLARCKPCTLACQAHRPVSPELKSLTDTEQG